MAGVGWLELFARALSHSGSVSVQLASLESSGQ